MSDTGEGGDKNLKKWVTSFMDGPLAISVIHLENNMWIFNECICRSFSCTNAIYSDSLEFATSIASIYVCSSKKWFYFFSFFCFFFQDITNFDMVSTKKTWFWKKILGLKKERERVSILHYVQKYEKKTQTNMPECPFSSE